MKDYLKKAIREGAAIDAYEHPEKVREFIEKQIGWMRNGFNDINQVIDRFVNSFRKQGVVYFDDIAISIFKWQMRELPQYLQNVISIEIGKLRGEE